MILLIEMPQAYELDKFIAKLNVATAKQVAQEVIESNSELMSCQKKGRRSSSFEGFDFICSIDKPFSNSRDDHS